MSLKPIKQQNTYVVVHKFGFRNVFCQWQLDEDKLSLISTKDSIQIKLSDIDCSKPLQKQSQLIQFSKKFDYVLQSQPFDIKSASYFDLMMQQHKFQSVFCMNATHVRSGQDCQILLLNDLIPVIKMNNEFFKFAFESLGFLEVDKTTVGIKQFKQNYSENCFKFVDEKETQKFVDLIQKMMKFTGAELEIQPRQKQDNKIEQLFQCKTYFFTKEQQEFQNFVKILFIGEGKRLILNVNQSGISEYVSEVEVNCSEENQISEELKNTEKLHKIDFQNLWNIYTSDSIVVDDPMFKFPVILETMAGSKIYYSFQTINEQHKFICSIMDKMCVKNFPVQLRFYIPCSNYRMNPYVQPVHSFIIEQFVEMIETMNSQFIQNILTLMENHPRSLPLDSKSKSLLQKALQFLSSTVNKLEKLAVLDFLVFCASSRLLFRCLVEEFKELLLSIIEETMKQHQDEYDIQFSCLKLLRSILSFQWRPTLEQSSASYTGASSSLTTGLVYKTWASQINNQLLHIHIQTQEKYVLGDYELCSFDLKNINEEVSQNQMPVIPNNYQQGSSYVKLRVESEKDNRTDLFVQGCRLINILTNIYQNMTDNSQMLLMILVGILEDVIISHSHIDQKYYKDMLEKQLKTDKQVQFFVQPPGRKEMMVFANDAINILINASCQKYTSLHNSVIMILKQMMFEQKLLSTQIRTDVSQKILNSGTILYHLLFLLEKNSDDIEKMVVIQLIGALCLTNKNGLRLISKIFPAGFLRIIDQAIKLHVEINSVEEYAQILQPFSLSLAPFSTFLYQLQANMYSLDFVWDAKLRKSILSQLQLEHSKFLMKKRQYQKISWNYEDYVIQIRGQSDGQFAEFDIDIDKIVLSQLICLADDKLFQKVGTDCSQIYELFLRNQRKQYLSKSIILTHREMKEQTQIYNQEKNSTKIEIIGQQMINELARININIEFINQAIFDKFLDCTTNPNIKCACLFSLQLISMTHNQKFSQIKKLSQETVRSIKENDFSLVLQELLLLECACFQSNLNDVSMRPYWYDLVKEDLIYYIIVKVLSLAIYENGRIKPSDELQPHNGLLQNSTYGNLIITTLRILIQCAKSCYCSDENGTLLIPVPKFYQILQSKAAMSILLSLLLVSQNQDESQQNLVIFQLTCEFIKQICIQSQFMSQYFVKAGLIELLLGNQLGEIQNVYLFDMLRVVITQDEAMIVLKKLLPEPFILYLTECDQNNVSIAQIFCSKHYVSINCIWTEKMREYLQSVVKSNCSQLQENITTYNKALSDEKTIALIDFIDDDCELIHNIWIENLEEHPQITEYEQISLINEYQKGGLYINLANFDQYKAWLMFLQVEIHDDLVKANHLSMLVNCEKALTMKLAIKILESVLNCTSNTSLNEIKERQQQKQFGQVGDYQTEFFLEISAFVLKFCIQQLSKDIKTCQELYNEEKEVRAKMRAQAIQTGNIINLVEYRNPDESRQSRIIIIEQMLRFFALFGYLMLAYNNVFNDTINNFAQVQTNNLLGLLQVSEFVIKLKLNDQIIQSQEFMDDYAEQSDIQIVSNMGLYYDGYTQQILQNEFKLFNLFVKNFTFQTEQYLNFEMLQTFEQLVLNIILCTSVETSKLFTNEMFQQIAYAFQKFYLQDYPLLQSEDYPYENNLLAIIIRLLQTCVEFDQIKQYIFKYNLPMFIIRGFMDGKQSLIVLLTKMYSEKDKVDWFENILKSTITEFMMQFLKQSTDIIIEKMQESCYSTQLISTPKTQKLIYNQLDHYCKTIDVLDEQKINLFVQKLSIKEAVKNELKIGQYYITVSLVQMLQINSNEEGEILFDKSFTLAGINGSLQIPLNNRDFFKMCGQYLKKYLTEIQLGGDKLMIINTLMSAMSFLCLIDRQMATMLSLSDDLMCKFIEIATIKTVDIEQEVVSELACSLLLYIVKISPDSANYIMQKFLNFLIIFDSYEQIGTAGLIEVFSSPINEHITSKMRENWFKCDNYVTRKQLVVLLMIEMQKATDFKHYDLVVLYMFLNNITKQDQTDFFAVKSFELINQRIGKSKFLRSILPLPLIMNINQGNFVGCSDFLSSDIKNPEIVWNQQCTKELIAWTNETFQQVIKNPDFEIDYNIHYQQVLQSINLKYGQYLIHNVYLNNYNEECMKGIVILSQPRSFVQALLRKIVVLIFETNDTTDLILECMLALMSFQSFQEQFSLLIPEDESFSKIFNRLMDPEYCCGMMYNQENGKLIFTSFMSILQQIVLLDEDFWKFKITGDDMMKIVDLFLAINKMHDLSQKYEKLISLVDDVESFSKLLIQLIALQELKSTTFASKLVEYPKLIEKLILILQKKPTKELENAILSIICDFLRKFEQIRIQIGQSEQSNIQGLVKSRGFTFDSQMQSNYNYLKGLDIKKVFSSQQIIDIENKYDEKHVQTVLNLYIDNKDVGCNYKLMLQSSFKKYTQGEQFNSEWACKRITILSMQLALTQINKRSWEWIE